MNQPLANFTYNINGGWPGIPGTSNPTTPIGFYNQLTGKWRDGSPLYAASNGYNQTGSPVTNYAFSGNPSNSSEWSMCTASLPGVDARAIGSTGPHNINPGEIIVLQTAYILHENILLPCPDITTAYRTSVQNVTNAFSSNTLDWIPNLGEDRTIDFGSTLTLDPNYNDGTNYLWSDGSTSTTLDVTTPGTYSVTITGPNGCQKTDEIVIDAYTSTEELLSSDITIFNVFPNPAMNTVNIALNISTGAEVTLSLNNLLGQRLYEQTIATTNINETHSFDVSHLPNGIYFISVELDGKHTRTEKIVVRK